MAPSLQPVADLFSQPPAVEEMQARVGMGLREWEAGVVAQHFPPGGRVLDVGCGPGREAIALTRIGYKVVGVDISPEVLDQARLNAAGLGVEFLLVNGFDMPPGPFGAVVMWAQVLGNMPTREDQLALLAGCREVMATGGVISGSGHYEDYCRRVWGQQTDADWFYPTGSWTPGELRYHMYTADALTALLREAGFEVLATEVPASLPAIVHAVGRKTD